ncbi:MAG TPA: ATP-binding protein, partial [Acidilobales archaeon]|nr:ATP-binding protein [Acidilobales archaeon]
DLPSKIIEDIEVAIINPIKRGMPFAARGAFITGPPGVGKSVMAEALASALGLKVVELRPQAYRSMWYGATEKMLNAIFQQVIKRRKEIALIIDDAEFISSRKYTIHEAHISEISTVLYHLQRPDRPFTILTANNPDLIDPAILRPGRIDVMMVLGYPDRDMRRKAILRHISRYKIKVSSEIIDKIVDITRWYSLAEVEAFIRLAAGKGDGKITEVEVEWTRRKFNISPSERASMQEYLRWWASKVQGVVITYIPSETEI